MIKNEYLPQPAKIEKVKRETRDTKTLRIRFLDKEIRKSFQYKPGQFMEISLFGRGEAPFSISSAPLRDGFLEFTIRAIGRVTKSIYSLKKGDILYLRGPYGNAFPFEEAKGKNLLFVAGGIGLAPLRSVINLVFDHRKEFGKIKILYGAKTPDELCYKKELKSWESLTNTEVLVSVDEPDEAWRGFVGVVTTLWDKTKIRTSEGIAYVCGPPIMIRFVIEKLIRTGFRDEDIYVSLERYMKCGIGKCGHCNIGEKFVCIDGPIFGLSQIKKFPEKERPL